MKETITLKVKVELSYENQDDREKSISEMLKLFNVCGGGHRYGYFFKKIKIKKKYDTKRIKRLGK